MSLASKLSQGEIKDLEDEDFENISQISSVF